MLALGALELVLILVIVFVIFGAGKLPQLGDALGKGIRNFKKATEDETPKQILEGTKTSTKSSEDHTNSSNSTG